MGYTYSKTSAGATYSSYYGVTSDGDYTSDSFTKTSNGAIYKATDTGNSGGYFTDYYGNYWNGGWFYSSYTNKTSSYNSAGIEETYSTNYYDSTAYGVYINDYQSKTSGGGIYKQTDTGNYGEYYLYNGANQSTYTDKSGYYNVNGTETSQYTAYYASTAAGDYTSDTYDKTNNGTIYKSTDAGNYGAYSYDNYGFWDYGWAYGNYTNKAETINSSGVVTSYSTSYYDATVAGNYTSDYNSKTSGGGIYKQTDTGTYGEYSLYGGTHEATYTDKSAYYNVNGIETSQYTSYYNSTAGGQYTSDTNNVTGGGDTYKSTNTGDYGYYSVDYGYNGYWNYGWTVDSHTDKTAEYNAQGVETAYSTSYYNSTVYGAYTNDYFSKSSGGDIYKSTDTGTYGQYGFYNNSAYSYYAGTYTDKNSSYNSAGTLTNASTSYYNVTASGNWTQDYFLKNSAGDVYRTTNTGNYDTGSYTDITQYFNSAGTRTGYSTTSGT